jgi:cytochrome b involved in lipid metabolism
MAARRRQQSRRIYNASVKIAAMRAVTDDHDSVADTASIGSIMSSEEDLLMMTPPGSIETSDNCDACPHCPDICCKPQCLPCTSKAEEAEYSCCPMIKAKEDKNCSYTMCQVRRHNHAESAWLVAGDTIYDVTSYMNSHPGGVESILRKSGGVQDCTRDLLFHSRAGVKVWKKYKVGKLRECKCEQKDSVNSDDETKQQWWMSWFR